MSQGKITNSEDLDKSWEFWKEIVLNPDGSLNVEQVKKELTDFKSVMDNVSVVYMTLTGGRISKILTEPQVVIELAKEHFRDA